MSVEEHRFKGPIRGQILFAIVFLAASVWLLSQLGAETKWVKRTKFFAQPRFWPAVAVSGMVLFGGLHLWKLPRKRMVKPDFVEWKIWFFGIEWVLWFLAYVWIVPLLGYLPTTVIFVPLMAWRIGYRDRRWMAISVGFAVAVVLLFKTFLHVKIPGGAVYEYLPSGLRSFFLLYL
ncbi:tripartite tricarboxylate transporter TctB family protein [Rhodalgimonas zhirmunskyi]|uniref:Tripartite tricarboxylate transporter TctB family protein n=1 Tax=Rhodalgimonas zhirmunskyi TaxID=2964767 RepID=A0AAJ1X6V5_9RHOB|nr:tripartite tricarboxylate transporter TctB family protein [Rhodoalgimonas zhirmunskyi]MDQ2095871.1 tripartite tricarboxylate transporter TctB family protein [Rhodoalgimonas zhirmunskyi]